MQNKLQTITIGGYKSIRHQEVKIKDMNVLIGPNGAGKSNFVGVFKFLRNVIAKKLQYSVQKAGGAESIFYYGTKETTSLYLKLNFDPGYYNIILHPTVDDSVFIHYEVIAFRPEGYETPLSLKDNETSYLETKVSENTNGFSKNVWDVLTDCRVYHFQDTSDSALTKKYSSIADSRFLFEDASNLAAFLFVLKETEPQHYERIVKTIQLVIPFFKDFVLLPNPLNKETIRIEWQDRYSDKTFTAADLSDGSIRFICMATLLLQPNLPKLVILDEPELGLHPSAITILAGLLKKASTRTQVIISTQSVGLVNEFDAEDIIVVERDGPETVFNRLDPSKLSSWLDEYSLGDLWDKNVIGGRP